MVWKAFAFASLLCISLLPWGPASASAEGCLAVDPERFEEIHARGALAGFDGWSGAVGYTKERLPMVPTLLATRDDVMCDLTHGFAAFVGVPRDASHALALAPLAVAALHVDVLPDAVPAGNVGVASTAPRVAALEKGYAADLTVWSPRNGVLADVHVVLAEETTVTFVVRDRAVGPFRGEPEGWNLLPGDTERTVAGEMDALATKVLLGTNADGTQWRVTYDTSRYSSLAEADRHAQMHLDGALRAYANETEWGLASADPDGILDLTLDGCDCIYSGFEANIHMFPRANDILALLPGLAYRTEAEVAELIVGHELFHHFQYSIMQWRMANWMIEGMARFSETVAMPDATFLPTTLMYQPNANGMNGYLLTTSAPLTGHSYDWSIVWGWLYAHEGGIALLVDVLHEAKETPGNDLVNGPRAIQAAMDDTPGGEHATFAESFRAFASATMTREGFVWGDEDGALQHDWATHFLPVVRQTYVAGPFQLGPWAFHYHDAKPTSAGAGAVAYSGALDATLLTLSGGAWTESAALPVNAIAAVDDAALLVVRGPAAAEDPGNGQGTYTVVAVR